MNEIAPQRDDKVVDSSQVAPVQNSDEPGVAITRQCIHPAQGEVITSLATGNSYTMGEKIGEGFFGVVYSCTDVWGNDLVLHYL